MVYSKTVLQNKVFIIMEHYEKGELVEPDVPNPLVTDPDALHMKVNYGSKIKNLMGYALKKFKDPKVKQIAWTASGQATVKAISCAEIMKKKIKGMHQITHIWFKRLEEYWEPKMEGLERLKVNRDIPAVTILLSKDPLDTAHPGYQHPEQSDTFWSTDKQKQRHDNDFSKEATAGGVSSKNDPNATRKRKRKPAARPGDVNVAAEQQSRQGEDGGGGGEHGKRSDGRRPNQGSVKTGRDQDRDEGRNVDKQWRERRDVAARGQGQRHVAGRGRDVGAGDTRGGRGGASKPRGGANGRGRGQGQARRNNEQQDMRQQSKSRENELSQSNKLADSEGKLPVAGS